MCRKSFVRSRSLAPLFTVNYGLTETSNGPACITFNPTLVLRQPWQAIIESRGPLDSRWCADAWTRAMGLNERGREGRP
jgi:hypothetical protein